MPERSAASLGAEGLRCRCHSAKRSQRKCDALAIFPLQGARGRWRGFRTGERLASASNGLGHACFTRPSGRAFLFRDIKNAPREGRVHKKQPLARVRMHPHDLVITD